MKIKELAAEVQTLATMNGGAISMHCAMRLLSYDDQADEQFILPAEEDFVMAISWLDAHEYGTAVLDDAGQIAGYRISGQMIH